MELAEQALDTIDSETVDVLDLMHLQTVAEPPDCGVGSTITGEVELA